MNKTKQTGNQTASRAGSPAGHWIVAIAKGLAPPGVWASAGRSPC